tara:strand:+ start:2334 stop:2738 length:405 start_codon:yes stop_codon:yes gene_type:complete
VDYIESFFIRTYFLDGQAAKQYLDYEELQEARVTANEAKLASIEANRKSAKGIRIAVWAIFISAIIGVLQLVLQLGFNPSPPCDVRIMEDTIKVKELQIEKVRLEDELFKADMLIKLYESDRILKNHVNGERAQ